MTKEEMKDKISMALKDPILQQGFEIICKNLSELEKANEWHYVKDGDLPEAENHFWSRIVLLQTNKGNSRIGFYDHKTKAWYEKATDDIVYGIVAWCEIPRFTEESKK